MRQNKSAHNGDTEERDFIPESTSPSHDDIARLAYQLWVERGCGDGMAEQDWLEAEQRLQMREAQAQCA